MSDPRRAQYLAVCVGLIAADCAAAQNVCLAPSLSDTTTVATTADEPFIIVARRGVIDAKGNGRLDDIEFRYSGGSVSADQASTSEGDSWIELVNNISLAVEGTEVSAGDARFNRDTEEMRFADARLVLTQTDRNARASAGQIVYTADRRLSLTDLSFTTCPEDDVDWEFRARSLNIDPDTGVATLRGATFRWMNVPVMKLPYFSLPTDDRRKSGFLTPEFSDRDRTGLDLTIPYYLNLAPNFDVLLEPRFMENRGAQIGLVNRYLLPASSGQLRVEYLPDDRILDRSRHFMTYNHGSAFGSHWELDALIENVSDPAYFEDLGDSLGAISQINLDRYVHLAYYAPRWSFLSRLKEYQTIDSGLDAADRPYQRLPQLQFAGRWGDRLVGIESIAEATMFDRPIGDTGWRFDTTQELSFRFGSGGAWLTPAIGFRQTSYRLDATPGIPERSFSRGLPVTSIDAGLRFERMAARERTWVQTIEPRLLYVRIPYEDQSELPIFDTVLPDFNLVQLFSKYQFVGPDRIADADQVSFGFTTRLIESASGRERLSATIGQTRYRNPRRIALPDETLIDSRRSNYVAELEINLSDRWNMDIGYQWNGETGQTVRAKTRLEFRPTDDHLFAIGYRKREDLLEQGDLSMVWPIRDRWRLFGQYSYSLLEKKALERFAGIEYESCCWRLRIASRQYIVRSTGLTDSAILFRFELKGLGQARATPGELLGRGILGST